MSCSMSEDGVSKFHDFAKMRFILPANKVDGVAWEVQRLLSAMSVCDVVSMSGWLNLTVQAVLLAPLHFRPLQQLKISHLRTHSSYESTVLLTHAARQEMEWCCTSNSRAIRTPVPDVVIQTDASRVNHSGRGAHCDGVVRGGRWTTLHHPEECLSHINDLKLQVTSLAMQMLA